jgi:SAM-dependent methyltransferase
VDLVPRLCLTIGAALRHVARFAEPEDPLHESYPERYFAHEVRRSPRLTGRFLLYGDVLEIGCGYGGLLKVLEDQGARPVGIDVRPERIEFALSQGYDARVADAHQLPFPDASFDAIVSDAVIEHLTNVTQCLRESMRVLRPGGRFYAMWGPAWFSYNGTHLVKCLGVPWVNLLFSDRVILRALEIQRFEGRWPTNYIDQKVEDFKTMGRVTRRRFRKAAVTAGFTLLKESSETHRPVKRVLSRLPVLDELLAGEMVTALEKTH